jgi:DNA-binding IclR family transcriptional regulator
MTAQPDTIAPTASRGIQSLEHALKVLEAMAVAAGPLSLTQLSEHTAMPPSKIHRYLASFQRAGMVRQDPDSGSYGLGLLALRLGLAALNRVDLVANAAAGIERLAYDIDLTILLNVWGPHGPTIIRMAHGRIPCITSLSLGSTLPVLQSATGQVFLAFLPRAVTRGRLDQERTAAAMADDGLDDLIFAIRSRHLAGVDSQVIPGLRALAAPVLDAQGEAAAVVTVIDAGAAQFDFDGQTAQKLTAFCRSLSV